MIIAEVRSFTIGRYTVWQKPRMDNPAFALLDWSVNVIQATPGTAGAAESTLVNAVTSATSPKVTVTFRKNSDYTAVDTADGDIVRVRLTVKLVNV